MMKGDSNEFSIFYYGVGSLTYLSSTSECEGKHFSYLSMFMKRLSGNP